MWRGNCVLFTEQGVRSHVYIPGFAIGFLLLVACAKWLVNRSDCIRAAANCLGKSCNVCIAVGTKLGPALRIFDPQLTADRVTTQVFAFDSGCFFVRAHAKDISMMRANA